MSRRYGSFQDGGAGFGGRNWNSTSQIPFESLELDESKDARTVFIGNLDCRVTRKMLYELMVQAGPVEAIRIVPPRDFNGGAPVKTISFVRYEHAVSVRYALLVLRDVKLFRSSITLNFSGQYKARQPPDFPPRPTTFFELPRGLEDASDKLKQSLVGRKFINDLKDYNTGFYQQQQAKSSRDYDDDPNDDDEDEDEKHFRRPQKQSDRRSRYHDDRDHHHHHHRQPQRTPRGDSSYPTDRRGRQVDEPPPQKGKHIRFDEEEDYSTSLSKYASGGDSRSARRSGKSEKGRCDGGERRSEEQRDRRSEGEEQRDRPGKKSKKDRLRSEASKRKRVG
ncbi:hypothetical protein BV898_10982 [Hypsibius exemplaris]|uniref:RRM domain-containing protein n=1 Tax=Hypsibius exemplaris TaxID=2072580 RepID=A0A1W0WI00_HYPEX|nr:hypothetical protein BV898_10982 [Hypsibius exemplaris]